MEEPKAELGPPGIETWVFDGLLRPTRWLSKAKELRRAARILGRAVDADAARMRDFAKKRGDKFPDVERIYEQWFLLLAFMLENVLKGLRVAQDPGLTAGGRLSKLIATHDLGGLADAAGLALVADERAVLDYLSDNAVSTGRYPGAAQAARWVGNKSIDFGHAAHVSERVFAAAGEALLRQVYPGGAGCRIDGVDVSLEEYVAHALRLRDL